MSFLRKIYDDLRSDKRYFVFITLLTLFYGLIFVVADFVGVPCSGMADYIQLFKYWLLIETAVFGLLSLLSLNKWAFAIAFPIITTACSVMTYYRYTVKAVLTPQVIDLVVVNDMRTSLHAVSWQLILTIIASIALSCFIVRYRWHKIKVSAWYVWLPLSLILIYYTNTRGHLSTELEQRMPYSLYYSVKEYMQTKKYVERERPMFSGKATTKADSLTVVLIIGESLRADHLQLNGYSRPTTPYMQREKNVVSLPNVSTDFSLTHLSIPHILTRSDEANPDRAYSERSFVSLLRQAGFHTAWLANQESVDTYAYFMKECDTLAYVNSSKSMYLFDSWLDGDILPIYEKAIKAENQFIILHTVGSHWFYNSHYDDRFKRYTPTADSRVINGNSRQQMINSYDNTILYSDWFWHQVITPLRSKNAIVLYISDHGESLGEDGYYTHGIDRPEQHSVAAWVWYSDKYRQTYPSKIKALQENARKKLKTYFMFHTILDAADVDWHGKDEKMSILK